VIEILCEKRPANVPQRYANQAVHAWYALHARWFFLSGFISCANKGAMNKIPKLKVAGSIPVARSTVSSVILRFNFKSQTNFLEAFIKL
jgi:hypothetical protein